MWTPKKNRRSGRMCRWFARPSGPEPGKPVPMDHATTPMDQPAAALENRLHRDAHGRLVWTDAQGMAHVGVQVVRAFPIDAPLEGLSVVGPDGHELAWFDRWADLPPQTRELLKAELAQREFMPVVRRLVAVSTFSTPSTWTVETDRGLTDFILKGEEDIRRLRDGGLLITDNHGLVFRVLDLKAMDRGSRRLLDRFL